MPQGRHCRIDCAGLCRRSHGVHRWAKRSREHSSAVSMMHEDCILSKEVCVACPSCAVLLPPFFPHHSLPIPPSALRAALSFRPSPTQPTQPSSTKHHHLSLQQHLPDKRIKLCATIKYRYEMIRAMQHRPGQTWKQLHFENLATAGSTETLFPAIRTLHAFARHRTAAVSQTGALQIKVLLAACNLQYKVVNPGPFSLLCSGNLVHAVRGSSMACGCLAAWHFRM